MVNVLFTAFAVITFIQIFFFLFFYIRVAFYRFKENTAPLPPVTVIICAKDEAKNLRTNLPHLCTQDYPAGYEVLVVNDNSEDDTMELLFDMVHQYDKLDYRNIPREAKVLQGKKFALTMGVKAAKYEHVILTDADCRPATSQWLTLMASRFTQKKQVVLGFGGYEKTKGFLNKCLRYETFFTGMQYLSFAMSGITYMGVGRNLGYTRKLFFSQNIFVRKPRLISGDDDLLINAVATKENTAVCIHKDSFTISAPKKHWDEWFYQKRRHMTTAKHYKWHHILLLTLYQVSHILFYVVFVLLIVLSTSLPMVFYIFGTRLLVTGLVSFFAMKKLKSVDLFLWFPIFDLLYLIYYYLMLPGIFNKKISAWK